MKGSLLEVKQLRVQIHAQNGLVNAVNGIDFTINRGEIFALIGGSGSGKSMTALSINRLLPENARLCEGTEILLEGTPIHHYSEHAMQKIRGAKIGMIFQDPASSLNPVMTIGDQIIESIQQKNHASKKQIIKNLYELLEKVKIPHPQRIIAQYPHQLSGGLKQRAMIAIALAQSPDLLIADEATTALDVTTQAQILNLIKDLNRDLHMGILLITHDFGIVAQMADRVAVMHSGKIVEQDILKNFLLGGTTPFTQQLFSALPERLQPLANLHALSTEVLLKVTDLKVYFPIRAGIFKRTVGHIKAVDGVSFTILEGQTLALVGESGCGKTTTGKALLRLIQPTSGQVYFRNDNILTLSKSKLRKKRCDFQIIFQDPFSSMDPRMRISDILEEGMKALEVGTNAAERMERIDVLLEQVGLSVTMKERFAHELSGGQRQRIAIARALSVGAQLIICDEPTSALDVIVQAQILKLLKSLQNDLGISYLFITHNISVINYIADFVAVMLNGQIVEYGPTKTLLQNPQHPYTQKLLHSVPLLVKEQGTEGMDHFIVA